MNFGLVVGDNTVPPVGWVVSSETCPFYSIGAELIREVKPGILVFYQKGKHRKVWFSAIEEQKRTKKCDFFMFARSIMLAL